MARSVPFAALCALVLAAPASTRAADYGVFVEVETEEDLQDLLSEGLVTQSAYEELTELLSDGVDLNEATRERLYALPNLTYAEVDAILAYREEAGRIADPAALVAAHVLDASKLAAMAAFIIVPGDDGTGVGIKGRIRYRTAYVGGDGDVPSMWLGARLGAWRYWDMGLVGLLTRGRLDDVRFDPNRDALSAEGPATRVHLPKLYVQYEAARFHVIAGNFRIGFGQRLTLDNTTLYTPNGIRLDDTIYYNHDLLLLCRQSAGEMSEGPCADDEYRYGSPDFRWTDRFRGVALGLRDMPAGPGWVQAYVFASFQTHDIYQYEIYDRGRCDDPRNDDDACKAPSVFERRDDPLEATSRFSYMTLPNMYDELVVGASTRYAWGRRAHAGITGYGASVLWLADGMDLDFQEWARIPFGGPFGAVGVDGAYGTGPLDIFAEVARSIDSQPEGGGFAGIVRTTATWKEHELEGALRWYGQDYANPHARPISEADEHEGLRARDEAGLRLKYAGQTGDFQLRASTDIHAQPSTETAHLAMRLVGDYEVTPWFSPTLYLEYRDKDVSDTGRNNCYDASSEVIDGEPQPCRGEKVQFAARLRFRHGRALTVTAKYQHRFVDDGSKGFSDRFRQDAAAWFQVSWKPIERLRIVGRLAWLFEDVSDPGRLEHSLWGYLEGRWIPDPLFGLKLRYELYGLLDDRESTAQRSPNPAHWLRLELESRF